MRPFFGHGAFVCKATTRNSDHNHVRDIIDTMAQAFHFVSSKEVVVAPWNKKPDVELVDPSGEFLTVYIDITLPALLQDTADSRVAVYRNARRVKAKEYPRKDEKGRLLNQSGCIPFILTSTMGGLCAEGHELLRICNKRNPLAAQHLVDILVTHSIPGGVLGEFIELFSVSHE